MCMNIYSWNIRVVCFNLRIVKYVVIDYSFPYFFKWAPENVWCKIVMEKQ